MLPDTEQPEDPWETPPLALDPELVETSQRLVSLSDAAYQFSGYPGYPTTKNGSSVKTVEQTEIEARNKYLFERNAKLVARVAELEAANLRLQEQVSALQQRSSLEKPWYLRWLGLTDLWK